MNDENNRHLQDPNLNREIKPKSERQTEAFEFLVREGMETAKKFGRDVTEEQVRKQIRDIVEPTERKASAGGFKTGPSQARRPATDSHDFIDENPNLKEI